MAAATTPAYVMTDHPDDVERQRLLALEAALDPWSTAFMESCAPLAGGSCLEVGGGAGSIARWMAGRVGPSGQVTVLDSDPRFLNGATAPISVVPGDVTTAVLGAHDLVHSRAVLVHVPARDVALERMTQAVRPGGWLVVEEPFSILDAAGLVAGSNRPEAFQAFTTIGERLFAAAGMDQGRFPIRLPIEFERLGLKEISVEMRVPWGRGGDVGGWGKVAKLTVEHLVAVARSVGLADEQRAGEIEALVGDPNEMLVSMILVQVRGRR